MSNVNNEKELQDSFLQQNRNKLLHYAEAHSDGGLKRRMLNLIDSGMIDANDVDEICKVNPMECVQDCNNFGLGQLDDNRDLIVRNICTGPDIIQGVLKADTTGMFVGASKSYKTWHMIRLGLCVAHGLPWFGSPTRKSKVLFVNPELMLNEFQLRAQCVAKELGIAHFENGLFNSLSLHKRCISPDKLMDGIENLLTRDKYELVILDSLYRLYGPSTDENSNGDMLRLMTRMEKMISNPNSAIIFSHHAPKGDQTNKRSIDVASGGGLGRFVATCITTRILDEEKNRYSLEYTLRYHAPKPSVGIIARGPKANLDTAYNKSELNGNNRYNNQAILNLLKIKEYTSGELQQAVKAEIGMSRSTFYDTYWPVVKEVAGVICENDRYRYLDPEATNTVTATS